MTLLTATRFVSCRVADNSKNIQSSNGGGYFYVTNDGNRYIIHVRNNSRIGNVDAE